MAAIPQSPIENERLEQALTAFEKAVEVDPGNIRAWGAYFRFHAAARPDPQKAQEVLEQLSANSAISELERTFARAQLTESVGQFQQAKELYLESIALLQLGADSFSKLVVHERAAQFFRSHDPKLAEKSCRVALVLDPNRSERIRC